MNYKRSLSKKNLYKYLINKCCNPDCKSGFDLEVHHIIPLSRGGTDTFDNYIVLCERCHRRNKMHRLFREKMMKFLTYKFFIESMLLGFDSNCSDLDFIDKVKKLERVKNKGGLINNIKKIEERIKKKLKN